MSVDPRVQEILARWESADPASRPSADELCADCPELLDRVRAYLTRGTLTAAAPQEESGAPVPRIPGYEIAGMLGRGGMGVVWRATQMTTRRSVALKIIGVGEFASPRARARFDREVELASRLTHPFIARVYDSGTAAGVSWYAMELVEGQPLDRHVAAAKLTRTQIIELMIDICGAVQHAHQFGVIHRDLKPGNIVVDRAGHPRLLDFGLAKAVFADASPQITMDEAPGTPAYMSPEQASGQLSRVGTGSDVYSLGVILYRLLLGRLPHDDSGSALQMMRRVATTEPLPPRKIDPTFPRDLSGILLKALAHEPEDRYGSPEALARDLRRWLDGLPIRDAGLGSLYAACKFARRHRARLLFAGGVAAVILAVVLVSSVRVIQERDRAITNEQIATAVNQFLLEMLASANPAGTGGRMPTLPELLDRAAERVDGAFPDQPLVQAAIRSTISETYLQIGRSWSAEPHARAAVDLMIRTKGPADPDTLAAIGSLAFVLYNIDRASEAESLLRPALATAFERLGEEHKVTDDLVNHLISALFYQDRAADAVPLARQRCEGIARRFGLGDPRTIEASDALAGTLVRAGELAEAERITLALIDQCLADSPPRRAVLCSSYLRLGVIRELAGDFADAEAALRDCIQVRIDHFGPDHVDVAYAKYCLARVLERQGRLQDAEQLLNESIEIDRKFDLGPSRLIRQHVMLARLADRQGRAEESQVSLARAAELAGIVLQADPVHDPDPILAYAAGLADLGKHLEARQYLSRALELYRQRLPHADRRVRALESALAVLDGGGSGRSLPATQPADRLSSR